MTNKELANQAEDILSESRPYFHTHELRRCISVIRKMQVRGYKYEKQQRAISMLNTAILYKSQPRKEFRALEARALINRINDPDIHDYLNSELDD